jgi:hypothetical protein
MTSSARRRLLRWTATVAVSSAFAASACIVSLQAPMLAAKLFDGNL